jgi:hypothetical protein
VLASGKKGTRYAEDTAVGIASASKWVWGAYIVEREKADLSKADFQAMTMRSGYVKFDYSTCLFTTSATVSKCFMASTNSGFEPNAVGRFHYQEGHFQKQAIDLGMGDWTPAMLTTEVNGKLGVDLTWGSPQPAAGIRTDPAHYRLFLQKLVRGELELSRHLGENGVCTQPSSCPTALSSPAPAAWHYSWGHWIEDEPNTGDGAFSSPGAFGFYPWVSADKSTYGMVVREELGFEVYIESANCGRAIRQAYLR